MRLKHFGIPEVNFQARAFKLGMIRDLMMTHDKSRVLLNFNICIFPEFFMFFLNEAGCLVSIQQFELFSMDLNNIWLICHLCQDLRWD